MTTAANISAPDTSVQTRQVQKQQLNQDFDDFLTLLTTQLQNQDPLDPMDSNEFTNQLVQFSQVEQQLATNDILSDLRALDTLRMTELGLGFVGMEVEVAGDRFAYSGSDEVELSYTLPQSANEATVTILNDDGETVYSSDGPIDRGINKFTWNGKNQDGYAVDPGNYTIAVSALNTEGKSMNVGTAVPGYVKGMESDGTGNIVLLIGDQKMSIADVTRVSAAKQPNTTSNGAGNPVNNGEDAT